MEFGSFIEQMRPGLTQAQGFQEMLRHVDAAEAWGLDAAWLGEIHCNPTRSVLSAPLVMAGMIFGRTRRLRVGTAVHLLPLNHPLRIAEEVATLDHVSEGRFDFGVGRSGNPRAYDAYGIPYGESQARFREALEIVRQAWTGEAFKYQGQFYRIETTAVSPKPYQTPHSPIRMAATSAETFGLVARLSLGVLVGLRAMDIAELHGHLKDYRAAWQQAGHSGRGSVHLRIPLYAASTEHAAREEPRETITYYMRRQAEITRQPAGRAGAGSAAERLSRAAELERLTYDEIL
ncbi:MAG: LLM class flavin-dependent oxidoreductase, partial [Candidatus Rokuibacteriota bacterium]